MFDYIIAEKCTSSSLQLGEKTAKVSYNQETKGATLSFMKTYYLCPLDRILCQRADKLGYYNMDKNSMNLILL